MQLKSLVEISNFQIVELLKSVVQGESCYNFQRILLVGDGRRRYSQQTVSHLAGHTSCRNKENMLGNSKEDICQGCTKTSLKQRNQISFHSNATVVKLKYKF